jgi:Family of unknown function (DUF6056)
MPGNIVSGRNAACVLWLAFLLWANLVTPLWADDYCRMTEADFVQAWSLAWGEYFTWTGRFFVTAVTYFVFGRWRGWTVPGFDLVNALVFAGLVFVVIRLAARAAGPGVVGRRGGAWQFATWLFVALMLWWLPRAVGEAALWKTGAVVYLWSVAGELFVLDRMLAALAADAPPWRWYATAGLAVTAFVMGNFLEPVAVLVSTALCLLVVRSWRERGRLPRGPAAVAALHITGMLLLLAAPGNEMRAQLLPSATLWERFFAWYRYVGVLFDGYWAVALAVIGLAWLVPDRWLGGGPATAEPAAPGWPGWLPGAAFLALTAAYLLLLLGVPYHLLTPRVSFPATVLIVAQLAVLWLRRPVSPARDRAGAVLVGLLMLLTAVVEPPRLRALARIDRDWSEALAAQRAAGQRAAVLPVARVQGHLMLARKERLFIGIEPGASDWKNVCYAHATGFQSITGI